MNFTQFQKTLATAVKAKSDEILDIRMQTVMKNNGIHRRAMEITGEQKGIYPTIYMEPYYNRYQNGVPVSQLADLVLEQCGCYRTGTIMPDNFFANYQDVQDRIYCKLINYDKNRELLKEVPHMRWLDLAIVCYYIVNPEIMQDASILIRTEHIRQWKIEDWQLIQNAWDITREHMRPVYKTLHSVLKEMQVNLILEPENTGDDSLYILTNELKTFGAVLIADPKRQKEIAQRIRGDYYVLPSSVHECLILPCCEADDEQMLITMIREINRTQVAPQEVLSDNLYYYDAHREIMMVRDGKQ